MTDILCRTPDHLYCFVIRIGILFLHVQPLQQKSDCNQNQNELRHTLENALIKATMNIHINLASSSISIYSAKPELAKVNFSENTLVFKTYSMSLEKYLGYCYRHTCKAHKKWPHIVK